MGDALHIRDATLADAGTIIAFNMAMARETEGKKLSEELLDSGVRAALSDPARARYFVASRGEHIIGQLMLTTEWSDWRNGTLWWIQSVYVRSDKRRSGVFRALYTNVEDLARSTPGVVGLRLYVEHTNAVAQQVYRGLGMHDAGYTVFERLFPDKIPAASGSS